MSTLTRDQLLPLLDKRAPSTEARNKEGDRTTVRRLYNADEGDAFIEKQYSGGLASLQSRENQVLFKIAHTVVPVDCKPVALDSRVASLHTFTKQTLQGKAQITVRWHGFDLDDWAKLLGSQPPSPWCQAEFVLAIARSALKALRLMHLAGLVHGDIKADNLCLPWQAGPADPPIPTHRATLNPDQLRLIDLGLTLDQPRGPVPDLGDSVLATRAVNLGDDRQVDAYNAAKQGKLLPFQQLGGCRAWGSARAGESFGASLGGGEACGWPTQRADNDGWHRKSPRPFGLTLNWG